jgi:hypothetical protein
VHRVLGGFRPDDLRRGWLTGLPANEAVLHPTRAGLRIGKPLPERGAGERLDETLEWERDGQYFHYLTKWMRALDQLARATGEARFSLWACELADAAHRAFVHGPPGRKGIWWKMSVDLSRPLLTSMGQHDALDGLVTYSSLQATAGRLSQRPRAPSLEEALADFRQMSAGADWLTTDPLGLGGLLTDAFVVQQLMEGGDWRDDRMLAGLLDAALPGLVAYTRRGDPWKPAAHRLAFRELGLATGLRAVQLMEGRSVGERLRPHLAAVAHHAPLASAIESFWLDPAHRQPASWTEHRDINEVMLATTLLPEGFLVLAPWP